METGILQCIDFVRFFCITSLHYYATIQLCWWSMKFASLSNITMLLNKSLQNSMKVTHNSYAITCI
jgi:hypothetical protein